MISLTTEAQVDILVEEVVEGMPSICNIPAVTGTMGFQQSSNLTNHAPRYSLTSTYH